MINLDSLEVRTERLWIRPLASTDYEAWHFSQEQCLPAQNEFDMGARDPSQCTQQWFSKYCEKQQTRAIRDELYVFGLFLLETGAYVGSVDLATIRRANMQWGNAGYYILNQHWGNKLGSEAVTAVLKMGFEQLGYNRIEAAISISNYRSIVLAESVNMHREGIRHAFIYEDEKWEDHVIYASTPTDFGLALRPPLEDVAIAVGRNGFHEGIV